MQRKEKYNIAIAGATGAVGQELLQVLSKRKFPLGELKLLASSRSKGKTIEFEGKPYIVEELSAQSFKNVDIALFSAGGGRSKEFAPAAVASGAVVIDNSSAFRMNPDVPLVVPEINPEDLEHHKGIIANPNCTTIIAGMAVWPIHQIAKVKRMFVATYQAVSGAGAQAMEELTYQVKDFLEGKELKKEIFKYQIAFNLFVHDSKLDANGYSEEEMKVVNETRKIFHDDQISISPTAIRVPILRAHTEAIHLELERPVEVDEVKRALEKMKGVTVFDHKEKSHFPMPIEVSGKDDVYVGHIRKDVGHPCGLNMVVCGDQILKGAALNAVQIAEELINKAR